MARKTVRLVIIGNEVLSGKVADANTPWLLGRLRQIGAVCTGVRIVPDEEPLVAKVVREDAAALRQARGLATLRYRPSGSSDDYQELYWRLVGAREHGRGDVFPF